MNIAILIMKRTEHLKIRFLKRFVEKIGIEQLLIIMCLYVYIYIYIYIYTHTHTHTHTHLRGVFFGVPC